MCSTLNQQDFAKSIRPMLKTIPEPEKEKNIKKMCIRDRSGFMKTPNGCWYHIKYVELVDVDIKTGKFVVKEIEDEDAERLSNRGNDLHYSSDFDFDYTRCIDTQHREIELAV